MYVIYYRFTFDCPRQHTYLALIKIVLCAAVEDYLCENTIRR